MNNQILRGFYPDPSICKVDDDFYLICSSFEFFPGVPIFHSKDLQKWQQIGNVLDRYSQLPLNDSHASHGIWAPTIRYNNGKFYMITTLVNGDVTRNFIVTATNPAGPWSEPIYLDLPRNGIDPSLLFADDKCYLTISGNYQAEINPDTGELLSEMKQIWQGIGQGCLEAPHLYKINDDYYIMSAEGGTGQCHMASIARGKSPWGPFENAPMPVVTGRGADSNHIQCCGHADLIEDNNGNWFAVFLGIRQIQGNFPRVHHLGRESFIAPVNWIDGFPICDNGKYFKKTQAEATKLIYDFKNRDFSWVELRNAGEGVFSFEKNNLVIRGNGDSLSTVDSHASMLLHRPIDSNFECIVEFNEVEGEGGVTLFLNENHHFDFYKKQDKWILNRRIGDLEKSVEFNSASMICGLTFRDKEVEFFTIANGERVSHISVLNRYLSIEVASGFTGLMVGMYANESAIISVKNVTISTI